MNKKTKSTNIIALTPVLIIVGQLLNLMIPSIAGVIRPDFSLAFLFLCIMIKPTIKQAFLASSLVVLTSMLLGSNPIFQIPAIFDRLASSIVCLILYQLVLKASKKRLALKIGMIYLLSTIVSGGVYILSVFLFGTFLHLPELMLVFKMGIPLLLITILSTALVNSFLGILLHQSVTMISKDKYLVTTNK